MRAAYPRGGRPGAIDTLPSAWEMGPMKLCPLALALALPLAACGGSDTPSETPASTGRVPSAEPALPAAEGAGHEHGELTPELDAFHEALAPRWHAPAGPQRTADACAAVPDFRTRADAVKGAAAPANAAAADWTQAGEKLAASVGALDEACKSNDAAKIEPAFSALHDAFHAAMELAGGKHGHGEGHGHGRGHGGHGHDGGHAHGGGHGGHGHDHQHGGGHHHGGGHGHGAQQPAPTQPN